MSERFSVPIELETLINDDFRDLHEEWAAKTSSGVLTAMPQISHINISDTEQVGYADLGPRESARTVGLWLPHAQGWKPHMYIRAEFARQALGPDTRMLVFPNNGIRESYYTINKEEAGRLVSGDLRPVAEKHVRVLEKLRVSTASLTGYSLGGIMAPEVAAAEGNFAITHINADETPSALRSGDNPLIREGKVLTESSFRSRTARELQHDFIHSGGWSDQIEAMNDAAIPALTEILNKRRLAVDYAKFGAVAVFGRSAKIMHRAMAAASPAAGLIKAGFRNPDAHIKVGRVHGSLLSDDHELPVDYRSVVYGKASTRANRKHTTGDNVVAHALMVMDGFSDQETS